MREDSTCRQVLSKTHNITSPSEPPLTARNLVGELLPAYIFTENENEKNNSSLFQKVGGKNPKNLGLLDQSIDGMKF